MPSPIRRRAKRVQVYLWPQVEADRVVLDVWEQIPDSERPQEVFRRALLLGLREMAALGELPERVLRQGGLGERLARRLPAAFAPPAGYPAQPPAHAYVPAPAPAYPAPAYPAVPGPEPAFAELARAGPDDGPGEDAEPDIGAMLQLMGGMTATVLDEA